MLKNPLRILAAFCIAAAVSAFSQADVYAQETVTDAGIYLADAAAGEPFQGIISIEVDANILPQDNDELFRLYVDRLFSTDNSSDGDGYSADTAFGKENELYETSRRETLSGVNRELYDGIKAAVTDIAAGERASSALSITVSGDLFDADFNAVLSAIMHDCPYELYWFDKTSGWHGNFSTHTVELRLDVSVDYSINGQSGTTNLNTARTSAASNAARRAAQIVSDASGMSDYEKLKYYEQRICDLSSYNRIALEGQPPYGDPWQVINVFDGDPSTEVVCEGYAKAFKYLCDMTRFRYGIECYLVEGILQINNTYGTHMWNIMHMDDGNNYLVDVTNCDENSWGENKDGDNYLFLQGYAAIINENAYRFNAGDAVFYYTYSNETLSIYNASELTLCGSRYVPGHSVQTGFTDVSDPSKYYFKPVLWAVENNITQGTTATSFSPDQACTRGHIVTFLWRAAGMPDTLAENTFSDVKPGAYYEKAVSWAVANHVTAGMSKSSFSPGAICTRAQAVTFLYRAAGEPEVTVTGRFSDVPANAYYARAVAWAVEQGITNGTSSSTFSPDKACSRGQIVTFLYRAAQQQ